MTKLRIAAVVSLLALSTGGCANLNSISRSKDLPSASAGKIYTVDAKQRHLIMSRIGEKGLRVCAEAAPDVFSALASSGALTIDASSGGSGQAGLSMAETAATIERTQTINMLRESFYRTCERYLSDAISKSQFVIQAARDQRVMTSILAIEQLTGAVRPPSTIISGPGTQASAFSGEMAAQLLEDYREKRDKAEATRDEAKLALDRAKEKDGVCAEGEKKDAVACAALETKFSAAQSDLDKAQAGLDDALAVAKNLTSSAAASTLTGTNTSAGLGSNAFDAATIKAVSASVEKIHKNSTINEPLMFCISLLSSDAVPKNPILASLQLRYVGEECFGIIKTYAEADQAILKEGIPTESVNFLSGDSQVALRTYLRPDQNAQERQRRRSVARDAARATGLGSTDADVTVLQIGGPESDRTKLVAKIKQLEAEAGNTAAVSDLGETQ